jgi:hypothetical protein
MYLTASATCNESPSCKCEYKFSIPNKPNDDQRAFITVNVNKMNDHDHSVTKKPILRGLDRVEAAQDCILSANGSAGNYVDSKYSKFLDLNNDF